MKIKKGSVICFILTIIDFVLTPYTAMYMWNHIITGITNLNPINFLSAFGLCVICIFCTANYKDPKDNDLLKSTIFDICKALIALAITAIYSILI